MTSRFRTGACRAEITASTGRPTNKVQISLGDANAEQKITISSGFNLGDGIFQSGGMRSDFGGISTIWVELLGFEVQVDDVNPAPLALPLTVKFILPTGDIASQTWS